MGYSSSPVCGYRSPAGLRPRESGDSLIGMGTKAWQLRMDRSLERLNSSLVWLGVTVFYVTMLRVDLQHVADSGALGLIISLRVILLVLAAGHAMAVLIHGRRELFTAAKWGILAAHFAVQVLMSLAYESFHILQLLIPLPTVLVAYFVIPPTPRLAITAGIGQTVIALSLTLSDSGFPADAALFLIPTMLILNALGISHLRTQAQLPAKKQAYESELQDGAGFSRLLADAASAAAAVSQLPLSAREREVVAELLKGRTRREIAGTLFISPETVKWHTTRVYRKLGVSTKIQLLQRVLAETDSPSEE